MNSIPPRLRFPLAVMALGVVTVGGYLAIGQLGQEKNPESDPVSSSGNRGRSDRGPKGTDARYQLESLLIKGGERDVVLKGIHEICGKMTEGDLDDVFHLLAGLPPGEMTQRDWRLYANEIMGRIVDEELAGISPRFLALASNKNAPPVIRDYSVQYFIGASRKQLIGLSKDAPTDRQQELSSLMAGAKALLESEGVATTTIYGTTLMGLSSVAGDLTDEERQAVREAVAPLILLEVTGTSESGMAAKISAIQAAARLGIEEAGPLIAQIACDSEAPFQRRLSALGALREYPACAPVEQLTLLAKNDRKLRFAAQSTLDYLKTLTTDSSGK